MCLLCDDEKAYQAYMNYLDAMERQGKARRSRQGDGRRARPARGGRQDTQRRDDPANDKTLSPFFCSPVNK